jgi:two-component system cell cycle sensor histidine kinase/response regulator CckA
MTDIDDVRRENESLRQANGQLRAVEVAQRRDEALFRALIEKSSEIISLTTADGVTQCLTPLAAEHLGWSPADIGSESFRDRAVPEDRARVSTELERVVRSGARDLYLEFRVRHPDGSIMWIESSGTNLLADPDVRGIVASYRNITRRKLAEEALEESERRYRQLIEGLPEPVLVHIDQKVAYANAASARAFGFASAADLLGRSMFDLATPSTRPPVDPSSADGGHDEEADLTELSFVRPSDGRELHAEIKSTPCVYDGRPATLSIARDITPRLEAERERTKLEHQLRQVQKMEAIGRLAGGVAHDFNNVLVVILSCAGLALDDLAADDPRRELLQEIEAAGLRAGALTRQLLAFSRKQVLQPRVVDLREIVLGMRSMLARLLGEDVELRITSTGCLGRVLADLGQLEQVVMNLAVNARDAMPDGGTLTFDLADVDVDAAHVGDHLGMPPGRYVVLGARDTGTGMDSDTRARIFEPFFTTKETGKGTGLGLSTVFGIVAQSRGHVRVSSEPGRGSTFTIYLPRTDQAPQRAPSRPAPALRGGAETILLVEDEAHVRAMACKILRKNGYEVLEAANGADALLVADEHASTIDLLLTDVVMPRMNGQKLALSLAPTRPALKVLFTSGYTDHTILHHGVLDSGVAFLQKPFTPAALLLKVREVLDTELTRPPAVAPPGP